MTDESEKKLVKWGFYVSKSGNVQDERLQRVKKQKENFDYAACAQEIFQQVGGRENLRRVTHCATRLRLVTADDTRADRRALERIEGVKGVFVSGGQLQVIIGPGAVNKVFDEFLKISGMDDSGQEEVKRVGREKQPLSVSRVLQAIGEVFVPLLPAIVSAGLISGIMELLAKLSPGFAASDWYAILNLFANTAFQFLPVLIAISAATIFGGNRFMAAVIGLIMVHPDLLNAWTAAEMDASQIPQWHVLGLTIRQVGYQGHVIPILIVIWLMSRIEKTLHRHVPESADLFITPLCTILPTAFLALGVIGPVFASAESYMLEFAQWLITVGYSVGSMIMGAIYPLTVVCGVHHMYNVIEAGMLAGHNGTNTWMPIASAANFAQGAACLAVGLKTKNAKMKSAAVPSAFSAMLGITEPAIFGINLRLLRPFICAMAGGAVGALLGALLHIGATSYGVSGLPGFLITLDCAWQYALMLAVTFVVTFAATWVTWKEVPQEGDVETDSEGETENESAETTGEENSEDKVASEAAGSRSIEKSAVENTDKKNAAQDSQLRLYSPLKGYAIPLSEVPDETFAGGILGPGIGIEPIGGEIMAPCDGEVSLVMGSHAVGITGADGASILIHVGIDTVKMNGDGFEVFVKQGDPVKTGQPLLRFDIEKIRNAGFSPVTVMVLANAADYGEVRTERFGMVENEDCVLMAGKNDIPY